jgi:polyhydroxybutyrate depolymerase
MGDVFKGLKIWTAMNGCSQHAKKASTEGAFWIKSWTDCEAGSVTLALGPGGHGRPKGWVALALDWFEALPQHDTR